MAVEWLVFISHGYFSRLPVEVLCNALGFLSPADLDSLELVGKELSYILLLNTHVLPGRRITLYYTRKSLIVAQRGVSERVTHTYERITVKMRRNPKRLLSILGDPKLACIGRFTMMEQPSAKDLLIFQLLAPHMPPLESGAINRKVDNSSAVLKLFVKCKLGRWK